MEVNLGGGNIGMSEDLLKGGDVFAVFQQVGSV
jgi:hypothetical protein